MDTTDIRRQEFGKDNMGRKLEVDHTASFVNFFTSKKVLTPRPYIKSKELFMEMQNEWAEEDAKRDQDDY